MTPYQQPISLLSPDLPSWFFPSTSRSPPLVHHHLLRSIPCIPPLRSPLFLSESPIGRRRRRFFLPPPLSSRRRRRHRASYGSPWRAWRARELLHASERGVSSPVRVGSRASQLRTWSVVAAAGAAHVGPEIRNLSHNRVSPYPALRPRSSREDPSRSFPHKVAAINGCCFC